MEEFNLALLDLKRSSLAQADDLSRSIEAVTDFRSNLPVLWDLIRFDKTPPARWRKGREATDPTNDHVHSSALAAYNEDKATAVPGDISDRATSFNHPGPIASPSVS